MSVLYSLLSILCGIVVYVFIVTAAFVLFPLFVALMFVVAFKRKQVPSGALEPVEFSPALIATMKHYGRRTDAF